MRTSSRAAAAAAVAVYAAASVAASAVAAPSRSAPAVPSVTVDFAHRARAANALGFMHGGLKRMPDGVQARVQARAAELQPGIWRGVPQAWSLEPSIVRTVGAEPVVQLGDIWGLPGHWPAVWPDQDLAAYARWVDARAAGLKKWFPHGRIWVDIWNEPDTIGFWPIGRDPSLRGYFSAFRTAERTLRRSLGDRVRIIGPSTASRASLWTGRLVDYCAKAGCRIDGIAWHANFQSTQLMAGLGRAMRRIRAAAAREPQWRKVVRQPAEFLITEYVSAGKRTDPGALLAYWHQIELGGGGRAAFSVWKINSPSDGLLDSLLDSAGRPRDSWWAARAYAVGRTSRVTAHSSDPRWPVLASRVGLGGKREAMVGAWGTRGGKVSLLVRGLKGRTARVKIATLRPARAPWLGHAAGPKWRRVGSVKVRHGAARLSVSVPGSSVLAIDFG